MKISVIIPALNAAATLSEAIESVRGQTLNGWELLIVDDGSTDQTAEIASKAALGDSRIKLMWQANAGVSAARNAAIDAATGRYVAFLDADDVWMPQKLELQLDFMKRLQSCFSFTSYRKFSPDVTGPLMRVPRTVDYFTLLKTRPIMCSSVIIDRDLVNVRMPSLPASSGIHEDLACWLKILRTTNAHGLNMDLLRLRKGRKSSRSSNKARAAMNVWRVYRNHERLSMPKAAWYFSLYAINSLASRL